MNNNCIFCNIAAHKAPAKIELETDSVVVFPSISPAAETHLLIVPKDHIEKFIDLEDLHKEILMEMAKVVQKLIETKKLENGYKLIFNGGKYQSVPHIHWHLLAGNLENEDKAENRT
jgi:histidine triad (HIT) family protein